AAEGARGALDAHPLVGRESGRPPVPAGVTAALLRERIERHRAVPLVGADGRLLGAMLPGHDEDDTLTGQVLLENLACKATAALAGSAAQVSRDDGVSPVLRLDAIGRHEVASGSAPLAIMKALYSEPLGRVGLTLLDVDRFSLELHNPEATEPAGSGNVPLNNYRTLASLAVVEKLIAREGI